MPPLPKRRRSRARQNKRMAHTGRSRILTSQCPTCSSRRVPHRVCPTCGIYNGRQVVTPRRATE
ncbi:MAG: 50S ribosomal protein L32 [Dehalococcoidia bacterium]|nr:50S ribosomal protein L32 [Dehalococcoidia bacterium]